MCIYVATYLRRNTDEVACARAHHLRGTRSLLAHKTRINPLRANRCRYTCMHGHIYALNKVIGTDVVYVCISV